MRHTVRDEERDSHRQKERIWSRHAALQFTLHMVFPEDHT
jgi:hypothetical protein